MDKKFQVRFFQDNTYEVFEKQEFTLDKVVEEYVIAWEKVYQGSLSDCEAYIRLHENGYM
jgi:hypothetical protein